MKKILLAGICALALSSCATTNTLYSWHNYEETTYKFSKKNTEELQEKVLKQYQKMLRDQKGTRTTVPPGLYAEYGFLLYKTNKKEEGLSYLKEEIKLYPESEIYISRLIKQLEK